MSEYGKLIANTSLDIGGIRLQPKEPFTWASGYNMPIYNDNRMLLGQYEHRMLVGEGFVELFRNEGIKCDAVAGTATAGIAPAATAAALLGVPMLIMEDGKAFMMPYAPVQVEGNFDAVASTCPWAIPFGVATANQKKLPFMYVRQKQKGHGLMQQIEGIPLRGQRVMLIDYHRGDGYAENARDALAEKGVEAVDVTSSDISDSLVPIDITGWNVPVIEDLISTGGSSAEAVQEVRHAGAISEYCASIFNYGLEKAESEFAKLDPDCNVVSLLTYHILMEAAGERGQFDPAELDMLKEWRGDAFNWGAKHGFPKVEK
jgi:orotate phosphoribosyltransferase